MALKYHPDKSPNTAPLFQIICTAYEKLSIGAPDKSTTEHAKAPPKSPQKTAPPAGPRPSQPSSSYNSDPRPPRYTQDSNGPRASSHHTKSGFTGSSNAYYPSSGPENMSSKFQKYQQEAREREARRQREYEAAAARSAQRRSQHGNPPPPPDPPSSRYDMPPPPPSGAPQYPYRSSTASNDAANHGAQPRGTEQRHTTNLPTPTGVRVTAVDASTAEIQWDPVGDIGCMVELSWAASTAPYGMWETSPKLVSGDRVRKKNLDVGALYKFRIRFAREEGGQ